MRPSSRLTLLLLLFTLTPLPGFAQTISPTPQIANGVSTTDWPEMGALFIGSNFVCSATVVGCRTVVTAAHCVCDPSESDASCVSGESRIDPARVPVELFLPQGGFFLVRSIEVPSNYEFAIAGDIAILKLENPVRGIPPRKINMQLRPGTNLDVTIAGFGDKVSYSSAGIKRVGGATTGSCAPIGAEPANHICWTYAQPIGPADDDSTICPGDSGGPVYVDFGGEPLLAGVHSGGPQQSCGTTPYTTFSTDVYVEQSWIETTAGVDLDAMVCGDGPQVGDAEVKTIPFGGFVRGSASHAFDVADGAKLLRVGLNGVFGATWINDLNLRVRHPSAPSTSTTYSNSATVGSSFEYLEIADPAPGTWYAYVLESSGGQQEYQVTVTTFPENPPAPVPTPGELLVASFSGNEIVHVATGDGDRAIASSSLSGVGAPLLGSEGITIEHPGTLLVANAFGWNLLRVDPSTGNRTIVSGCVDAVCSNNIGGGPGFLIPRFVTLADELTAIVTDRLITQDGGFINAVVRVDLRTGARTVVSGCDAVSFQDESCTHSVGNGPAIGRIFGVAVEADGSILVADTLAVLRIDPANGDRTIVSGCQNSACTGGWIGAGPEFGEPVDVLVDRNGDLFVTYQINGSRFGALRKVDPLSGERTLVSGCIDSGCSQLRGSGVGFAEPFGFTIDDAGGFLVADPQLEAVIHVDRSSGDRTVVSGCNDVDCSTQTGDGTQFVQPVDVAQVPEPDSLARGWLALVTLSTLRRRAARGRSTPGG